MLRYFIAIIISSLTAEPLLSAQEFSASLQQNPTERGIDAFFSQLHETFLQEYTLCNDGATPASLQSLIEWKKAQQQVAETAEYQKLLGEYYNHHPTAPPPLVCQVIAWKQQRHRQLQQQEDSLAERLTSTNDTILESFMINRQFSMHQASEFDFGPVRFGMTKKTVTLLIQRTFGYSTVDSGAHLTLIEHFPIADYYFMVRFYFSRGGSLYQYDIEGYRFKPDQLELIVRPEAAILEEFFSRKAGTPSQKNRIGYLDIKPETGATMAVWSQGTRTATLLLALQKGYFYTLLRVGAANDK
ncbi:MAG: hypothetical protein JW795_07085 [Chitinivibrionales bacterium]|nr:hypothetical protein [Chitinivibrionales bacterium]